MGHRVELTPETGKTIPQNFWQRGTSAAHGVAGSRLQTTLPPTDLTQAHHIDCSHLVVT